MDYGDDMLSPIENVDPNQLPSVLTESFKQSKITFHWGLPKENQIIGEKRCKKEAKKTLQFVRSRGIYMFLHLNEDGWKDRPSSIWISIGEWFYVERAKSFTIV